MQSTRGGTDPTVNATVTSGLPHGDDLQRGVGEHIGRIFMGNPDKVEIKLANFPKYVRRRHLKRFLAFYEIFKLILPVKGCVVECGVYRGFGLMSWAKISSILEPENVGRRVYGFDTFQGFPSVSNKDKTELKQTHVGELGSECEQELAELIAQFDADRTIGHISKVELVRGDIQTTVPEFLEQHPELVVSLLFLDCDLYEPTKVALQHFLPRMPRGAVIAFDELDNPLWPGETAAVQEVIGLTKLTLKRIEWGPFVSYAVLD